MELKINNRRQGYVASIVFTVSNHHPHQFIIIIIIITATTAILFIIFKIYMVIAYISNSLTHPRSGAGHDDMLTSSSTLLSSLNNLPLEYPPLEKLGDPAEELMVGERMKRCL